LNAFRERKENNVRQELEGIIGPSFPQGVPVTSILQELTAHVVTQEEVLAVKITKTSVSGLEKNINVVGLC